MIHKKYTFPFKTRWSIIGTVLFCAIAFLFVSFNNIKPNILKRGIHLLEKEAVLVPAQGSDDYAFYATPWVTNKEYKLYLSYIKVVWEVDYPEVYQGAFPYPKVDQTCTLPEEYFTRYWLHPAFDNLPVVGLSWRQAMTYAHWRSNIYNEYLLIKAGLLEPYSSQIGEDAFCMEAFVYEQYMSGLRKPYPSFLKSHGDLFFDPPEGAYLPGFRLPTAREKSQLENIPFEQLISALGKPLLSNPKNFLSQFKAGKNSKYTSIPEYIKANPSLNKQTLGQTWQEGSIIFMSGNRWEEPTWPAFPVLEKNFYEPGIWLIPEEYRARNQQNQAFYDQNLARYLNEVDSFAAIEGIVDRVRSFIEQSGTQLLLESNDIPNGAPLSECLKMSQDGKTYQPMRDEENMIIEKGALGKMDFQIIGLDQKGHPICIPSTIADDNFIFSRFNLSIFGYSWTFQRLMKLIPPRKALSKNGDILPQAWYEGQCTNVFRLVNTPYRLPLSCNYHVGKRPDGASK